MHIATCPISAVSLSVRDLPCREVTAALRVTQYDRRQSDAESTSTRPAPGRCALGHSQPVSPQSIETKSNLAQREKPSSRDAAVLCRFGELDRLARPRSQISSQRMGPSFRDIACASLPLYSNTAPHSLLRQAADDAVDELGRQILLGQFREIDMVRIDGLG